MCSSYIFVFNNNERKFYNKSELIVFHREAWNPPATFYNQLHKELMCCLLEGSNQ